LRLYRLHLVQSLLGAASVNAAMTALRFFFSITLDRYDLRKPLFRVEQPRKLPTVLTQDEVARLLDAAPRRLHKPVTITELASNFQHDALLGRPLRRRYDSSIVT
jgi:integrase